MELANLQTGRRQRGVTLIELMVVMVIIAILSTVAYPSYTQYVARSKRSAAQSMLLQVADRQQQYFMDNKRFAPALTDLGYPANPIAIGSEGEVIATGDAERIYQVELDGVTPTSYTIRAVPQLVQAKQDAKCGTLTFDQTGAKGAGGAVADCW